jgi:hypothetical protein
MFFPTSRYLKTGTYIVPGPDGTPTLVARWPISPQRERVRLLGSHPRRDEQHLDAIADHYLAEPTGFWRLADANVAMVPDALAVHPTIGIPVKER